MRRLPKIEQAWVRMGGTGERWVQISAQDGPGRRITVYKRTEEEAVEALMTQMTEEEE